MVNKNEALQRLAKNLHYTLKPQARLQKPTVIATQASQNKVCEPRPPKHPSHVPLI